MHYKNVGEGGLTNYLDFRNIGTRALNFIRTDIFSPSCTSAIFFPLLIDQQKLLSVIGSTLNFRREAPRWELGAWERSH